MSGQRPPRRGMGLAFFAGVAIATAGSLAMAQSAGIGLPGRGGDKPFEINADDGIEWQQRNQAYIARGNVRASQGNVVIHSNLMTAYYRQAGKSGTEVWRINATGNVRIVTPTQTAYGDKAVYDVDDGVLVLTGKVRLVTETDYITARDSIEFWEKKNLVVARGDAIAVRGDNRMRADILTAHFEKNAKGDSKVKRIDAFDNVLISSPGEVVQARRGVYNLETGIAVLTGAVKITRGQDQLNGEYAEVNLNTGVSRLFSGERGGVRGYFAPRDRKAVPRRRTPQGKGS